MKKVYVVKYSGASSENVTIKVMSEGRATRSVWSSPGAQRFDTSEELLAHLNESFPKGPP